MDSVLKVSRHAALALVFAAALASGTAAESVSFQGIVPADAIGGLDAVELAEGRQVEGVGRHTYVYAGLQWRFSSEANKQLFIADPSRFTSQ